MTQDLHELIHKLNMLEKELKGVWAKYLEIKEYIDKTVLKDKDKDV